MRHSSMGYGRIAITALIMSLQICWTVVTADGETSSERLSSSSLPPLEWLHLSPLTLSDSLLSLAGSPRAVDLQAPSTFKLVTKLVPSSSSNIPANEMEELLDRAMNDELLDVSQVPESCSLSPAAHVDASVVSLIETQHPGVSLNEWSQWPTLSSKVLPKGKSIVANGRSISWFMHVLPLGSALSLPYDCQLTCSVRVKLPLQHTQDWLSNVSFLIRASHAEVSMVRDKLHLMDSYLSSVSGGKKSRGAAAGKEFVDVDEASINRDGLVVRVVLHADRFWVNTSAECRGALGYGSTTVSGVDRLLEDTTLDSDLNPVVKEYCLRHWRLAVEHLKEKLVQSISCGPLPCLFVNPLYNVSRWALGGSVSRAVDLEPFLQSHSNAAATDAWARDIMMDAAEGNQGKNVVPDVARAIRVWQSPPATAARILKPQDVVVLTDHYFEIRVDPDVLRQRGFFLPSLRQVCWWWKYAAPVIRDGTDDSSASSECVCEGKEWDKVSEEWRRHMRWSEKHGEVFEIRFDLPDQVTAKQLESSHVKMHSANQRGASCKMNIAAMNPRSLAPRGSKAGDTAEPYASLAYDITHPLHGAAGWQKLSHLQFVPFSPSCVREATTENRSSVCPPQFGVVGPHLLGGFQFIAHRGHPHEVHIRKNIAYLACPPPASSLSSSVNPSDGGETCGERYYGAFERKFADYFRNEWIDSLHIDKQFNRLIVFRANRIPAALGIEQFGNPVYVMLRVPRGVTTDDYQYPKPITGENDVYGFVFTSRDEDIAPPHEGMDSLKELHVDEL